jgi:hypothetical protein
VRIRVIRQVLGTAMVTAALAAPAAAQDATTASGTPIVNDAAAISAVTFDAAPAAQATKAAPAPASEKRSFIFWNGYLFNRQITVGSNAPKGMISGGSLTGTVGFAAMTETTFKSGSVRAVYAFGPRFSAGHGTSVPFFDFLVGDAHLGKGANGLTIAPGAGVDVQQIGSLVGLELEGHLELVRYQSLWSKDFTVGLSLILGRRK